MILCNRKMMTALLCATAVWSARAAAVLPAVRVEKVGEISRTEAKTYVGTVHGSETVDIVARINGVMWKSAFKEGSIVRKGDLLFQIEDTIYRENVNAAHAALDQNQAELNYAAKEKARYEKLYKSSATAQTTYENAIRTFKVSEAKTLEAKAKLVLAENDLSYTKIRAPLSGRIGRNVYSEGNYITPEKGTLATIVQFDPIEVRFAMSEADFFKYSKNGTLASDGLEIIRADSSAGSMSVDAQHLSGGRRAAGAENGSDGYSLRRNPLRQLVLLPASAVRLPSVGRQGNGLLRCDASFWSDASPHPRRAE